MEESDNKNKSAVVPVTSSPYQNNEGPLQRDEVKATFNKEETTIVNASKFRMRI